jgi:geranylgeranyl diphosphate synthase type II
MDIFKACNVDAWAIELKEKYLQMALANLDDIAVTSTRKSALLALANYLMQREN